MIISTFLAGLLAGSCASGTDARRAQTVYEEPDRPPNFLFIYTDDQRFDCLGVVQEEQGEKARFPWLQTPNLDRLAAEGARFRNAFVVQSLCTPSRASFLTGTYTHTHGIFTNFTPFPENMMHFGKALTGAGYRTGYIGKWHMGRQGGKRPGFTYSASYLGQGVFQDCPFELDGVETATRGWVDDVATDYALDFIRRNQEQPFAVALGYKSGHIPCTPPERLAELYRGEHMGPAINHTDLPVYLGRVHMARPEHLKTGGNVRVEDEMEYFRTLTAIDENVGRLMEVLDELGLSRNTMVIFSSDNGYHFGEHGIGDKRSAYEVSMRVPMIIRYPGLPVNETVPEANVLNIDVAPTIMDFAGIEIPDHVQGRSLRPLLEGQALKIREAFLYEYFFSYTDITDYEIQTGNPPITPTIVALRTDKAKLITYPGRDWLELFDLENDPYERDNLAGDPEHAALLARMQAALAAEKERLDFRIPEKAKFVPDDNLEDWRR